MPLTNRVLHALRHGVFGFHQGFLDLRSQLADSIIQDREQSFLQNPTLEGQTFVHVPHKRLDDVRL
jgi:hypothetical protein